MTHQGSMFIVVHIGCLECSIPSAIVGSFTDKEKADGVAADLNKLVPWSAHEFCVFPSTEPNQVGVEYAKMIETGIWHFEY